MAEELGGVGRNQKRSNAGFVSGYAGATYGTRRNVELTLFASFNRIHNSRSGDILRRSWLSPIRPTQQLTEAKIDMAYYDFLLKEIDHLVILKR